MLQVSWDRHFFGACDSNVFQHIKHWVLSKTYYETSRMQLQRVPFRNSSRMFTIFSCMLGWRHCSGTWGISNRSYFGRAPPRSVFGSEPVLLVLYSLILNTLPRKNDKINNSYYLPCPHVFCTGLIKREPSRAFLYKIICILQSNLAGIDILLCSPSFSLF